MKKCNRCNKTKPFNDFNKNPGSPDGRFSLCKRCKKVCRNLPGQIASNAKYRAKKCGLSFNITKDYIKELNEKQGGTCAITGIKLNWDLSQKGTKQRLCPFDRVSLDRIDCTQGYIIGNVQLVTDAANRVKSFLSMDELLEFCRSVVKLHEEKT